jgi:predicted nuclease of restriction endonuclease-like (RecB) superfamily
MKDLEPALNGLLGDLRELVGAARARAAASINSELVMLYWHMGQRIRRDVMHDERGEYGQRVMTELARALTAEFGKGYSRPTLFRMLQFAALYQDEAIVSTLSRQLSWSHFLELMSVKTDLHRDFYTQLATLERWSVRTLRERIGKLLFERTALSSKPEVTIRAELDRLQNTQKLTPDLVFRNPYLLDFLRLQPEHSERDLEDAILRDIETFLLEMGAGFAFIARQKRISVGSEDYYLDLLLFHRDLQCLVAIELKLEKFQAAHKGQMELYLNWLDRYERRPHETKPLGLILCASAQAEHVELMNLDRDNIRVAEYLTKLPALELLQAKLHQTIELARARQEQREA